MSPTSRLHLRQGVTVAAWLKPSELGGKQTIFRKRDGLTSSVALMMVNKHYVFVISRQNDVPAAVVAPAPPLTSGPTSPRTYDGTYLRLYLERRWQVASHGPPAGSRTARAPAVRQRHGFAGGFEGTHRQGVVRHAARLARDDRVAAVPAPARPS